MTPEKYIVDACEKELLRHGDTYRGAGYTRSPSEPQQQYEMMLQVIRNSSQPISVLDLGCGPGHLYDFIQNSPYKNIINYSGADLSKSYIDIAAKRQPNAHFMWLDGLNAHSSFPLFDYVVMNGLFNYKGNIPYEEMIIYWSKCVSIGFSHARVGIAFNVMSKYVDWERNDLFHLPFDMLANYISQNLSKNFVIRHDYGRFEYTTYVYREASV